MKENNLMEMIKKVIEGTQLGKQRRRVLNEKKYKR